MRPVGKRITFGCRFPREFLEIIHLKGQMSQVRANHDRTGVFAMRGVPGQPLGRVEGLSLVDVGPTILSLYDIDAPEGAQGRSFLS